MINKNFKDEIERFLSEPDKYICKQYLTNSDSRKLDFAGHTKCDWMVSSVRSLLNSEETMMDMFPYIKRDYGKLEHTGPGVLFLQKYKKEQAYFAGVFPFERDVIESFYIKRSSN